MIYFFVSLQTNIGLEFMCDMYNISDHFIMLYSVNLYLFIIISSVINTNNIHNLCKYGDEIYDNQGNYITMKLKV